MKAEERVAVRRTCCARHCSVAESECACEVIVVAVSARRDAVAALALVDAFMAWPGRRDAAEATADAENARFTMYMSLNQTFDF